MTTYWHCIQAILPTANRELLAVTGCSTVFLVLYFYTVQSIFQRRSSPLTQRQKSWLLTSLTSAVTVVLSLPFVASWLTTGCPMEGGRAADYGCAFFVAYLTCDLILGLIHYSSSITILTGWIHHTAYILLISLIVVPCGYSSIFSMCFIFELPTLLLAVGNLHKSYRNDYLFACVFFLTRVIMHIHVGITYGLRAYYAGSTWVPSIVLSCVLPLHIKWLKDSVTGIVRRRRAAATAAAFTTPEPAAQPSAMVAPLPSPRPLLTLDTRTIPIYPLPRSAVTAISALAASPAIFPACSPARRTPHTRSRFVRRTPVHPSILAPCAEQQKATTALSSEPVHWSLFRRRVVGGRPRRNVREMRGSNHGPWSPLTLDAAPILMAAAS